MTILVQSARFSVRWRLLDTHALAVGIKPPLGVAAGRFWRRSKVLGCP